jgi:hypothetical protein
MPRISLDQVYDNSSIVLTNNKLGSGTSDKCEKVKKVAKVVFSILLSLVFLCINPAIFFISFVIGLAFSKSIQKAVDKIKLFMSEYKWQTAVGCVLASILLLPVAIATGSVIWSAYMGSHLSQRAQRHRA